MSSAEPPRVAADDFLVRLLEAMREAAERSRTTALTAARADAARLVEEARHRSASEGEELQRRTDEEAAAIATWHETELSRLRAEVDQRLAEHEETRLRSEAQQREGTQRRILAIQARLAEYETLLGRFFSELEGIDDPAAFVAAASRLPVAPQLRPSDDADRADTRATTEGGSVTTSIAVAGHDSFGAVTSVKQALERVPGVGPVSLGLGEAGEFVLTAEHEPGLDLRSALGGLGLRGARVEGENGSLRVALGPIP
ncbi:MAG TPA: hypothetical protein VJA85_00850 [Candidatus Limnocylindria bacterium]|nr:hypothetical protein [Candidatus Limnocylindria bacterium]